MFHFISLLVVLFLFFLFYFIFVSLILAGVCAHLFALHYRVYVALFRIMQTKNWHSYLAFIEYIHLQDARYTNLYSRTLNRHSLFLFDICGSECMCVCMVFILLYVCVCVCVWWLLFFFSVQNLLCCCFASKYFIATQRFEQTNEDKLLLAVLICLSLSFALPLPPLKCSLI